MEKGWKKDGRSMEGGRMEVNKDLFTEGGYY